VLCLDRLSVRGGSFTLLQIEHLTKTYPSGTHALDDVSLSIADGEFVVVVGLSGAGKSTLLRCINRLVEPSGGSVLLDGADVTTAGRRELRLIRRRIGMVFQQFNLVKRASVLENVLCGRLGYVPPWQSLLGYFPPTDHARAWQAMSRVSMEDQADQRADTLSGGQQQRVAIARALMQEPTLMLADEPVASLDPATSHSVLRYLEQINHEDGMTVVCSLHFLSLARRYASRVVALKAGAVVFDGPPALIDKARFAEIYGEEAADVEVG
jgi:phosphonate transport system ATP-binding protein